MSLNYAMVPVLLLMVSPFTVKSIPGLDNTLLYVVVVIEKFEWWFAHDLCYIQVINCYGFAYDGFVSRLTSFFFSRHKWSCNRPTLTISRHYTGKEKKQKKENIMLDNKT